MPERRTDVLVVGGGLGGVAAALAVCRRGRSVVLSEPTDWLGGQLTSQAVPPDEHPWIEQFGCTASYRQLRDGIRDYYRSHYPLTEAARGARNLNPGDGRVSKLCHEPRVALAVIESMLAPHRASGRLTVLLGHEPAAAHTDGDTVRAVTLRDAASGDEITVAADYVLDATETGDLLPLAGAEYVTGAESRDRHGEPHAPDVADPANMQSITVCFAVDHRDGENHVIDRPRDYAFWRDFRPEFWPGPLLGLTAPDPPTLEPMGRRFVPHPDTATAARVAEGKEKGDADLWLFRRILSRDNHRPGAFGSDVTLVNWPLNDYWLGNVIEVDEASAARHLEQARQLSLSVLYWLQTEAPRPDGGTGFPGVRLRPDVTGTRDGLAKAAYIRESRRIEAVTTVTENDVSLAVRGDRGATPFEDSVGVGSYRIDLHPSTGGDNYIDIPSLPFRIPLGALLPVRMRNLLPAAKNIGTTHITNGCYRLHPVEWNIGEAAGALAAHCLEHRLEPQQVHGEKARLADFRAELVRQGVELAWPEVRGY
ncbi:FAD-dependent oxidoreductase [Streptomyces meridianus]|uniref:FAD-dependent oxidoreductase n=1 Tax=Streptomyces meridianus TaxID=2938945 RepID=A0ABT0X4U7_9ACTN|nr:FAD-dependent oxidoreductase [Streptomyces meridianus]MCM2577569.1 FAD-dependent oxidoreductase [Streptomyces meridianus]